MTREELEVGDIVRWRWKYKSYDVYTFHEWRVRGFEDDAARLSIGSHTDLVTYEDILYIVNPSANRLLK